MTAVGNTAVKAKVSGPPQNAVGMTLNVVSGRNKAETAIKTAHEFFPQSSANLNLTRLYP